MDKTKRDQLAFDAAPSKRRKDENGYLHVALTPITKATVNPYFGRELPGCEALGLAPDAMYYGLRDPEELKKAAATFNGLPVLICHKVDSADQPQKELRIGSTGTDAVFKSPYLLLSISITDADAIERIENGEQREISAGYRFDVDMTPGVYEGAQYDFVMRNIRGNHIAIVSDGRAGADVVVADEMPSELKAKGSDEMEKKEKKLFIQSARLAMDEALKTARDEAVQEQQTQASDEGESIDEIVGKLLPNATEENKVLLKAFLSKLQSGIDTAAPAPAMDNESASAAVKEEVVPDVAKDEDAPAQVTKDEDPAAEKKEAPGVAMDENTVRKIEAAATQKAMERMRGLTTAARQCSPLLGSNLDALAFDSADDIYAKALQLNGVNPANYPKSAYRGMVDMMLRNTPQAKQRLAMDSMPKGADKEVDAAFTYLDRIEVQ